MKVIALVSGGKDSTFSMTMCAAYGHEIVALANLLPVDAGANDIDSYMYQTVGHQVIDAYASCCGLPLYRRRILGHSYDKSLVYKDTPGDEVEDLAALLSYIKQDIPSVEAVASGAIASDYQRTRVERVCSRLRLVSLAYLWHQPQINLLCRMIESPIEAILVKIAAAGLTPGKHLGAGLKAMLPQLLRLRKLFELNVCGEGGEYETLTLDCPLFKFGRIVLDSWECIDILEDSMAPVAVLQPTAFHVEPKAKRISKESLEYATLGHLEGKVIQVPDDFKSDSFSSVDKQLQLNRLMEGLNEENLFKIQIKKTHGKFYLSITAEAKIPVEDAKRSLIACSSQIITNCLILCLSNIGSVLLDHKIDWKNALFVHLYLPDIKYFDAANQAYACIFPEINPPARACVEIDTSEGYFLGLEVLFAICPNSTSSADPQLCFPTKFTTNRKVLHVQSISEWAPACIGPYAQAVRYLGFVYFAGQIPLEPATMKISQENIRSQIGRCLLSCQAVAIAMKTDLSKGLLWCTVYTSRSSGPSVCEVAEDVVKEFLVKGIDAINQSKYNDRIEDEYLNFDCEDDSNIDEYLRVPILEDKLWSPLVLYLQVPDLPKGAKVEIQPVAWADEGMAFKDCSESDSDEENRIELGDLESCLTRRLYNKFQNTRIDIHITESIKINIECIIALNLMARLHGYLVVESDQDDTSKNLGEYALSSLAENFERILSDSRISCSSISAAKLYYSETYHEKIAMQVECIQSVLSNALHCSFTLVPVLAVGSDAQLSAIICAEIFARM